MKSVTIHNLDELGQFARDLVTGMTPLPGQARVLCLQGDLGAGKTTLTQYIARELGVTDTVISPTFVIMKSYSTAHHPHFDTLVHIDAYRLNHGDELLKLRFDELLSNPRNLVIVEWPELVPSALPDTAVRISLALGSGDQRIITIA